MQARDVKESICYVAESKEYKSDGGKEYEMPDGNVINFGDELFKAPELLFEPEMIDNKETGIRVAKLVFNCIMKLDHDRRDMYQNTMLTGGGTRFKGFTERVRKELQGHAPSSLTVKCYETDRYASWKGANILAGLTTFNEMWITRSEYDDSGAGIVARKCF